MHKQILALTKAQYVMSFLAVGSAQYSYSSVLQSTPFLARGIRSDCYYDTALDVRVWPDLCQCGAMQVSLSPELIADARRCLGELPLI